MEYPRGRSLPLELTAVYRKVPEGYVAFVEELPGANTQGATLEEARHNLREAVELVLEANRPLSEEHLAGTEVNSAAPAAPQLSTLHHRHK
jgi:predicted RNase H-like HicB family nuclease